MWKKRNGAVWFLVKLCGINYFWKNDMMFKKIAAVILISFLLSYCDNKKVESVKLPPKNDSILKYLSIAFDESLPYKIRYENNFKALRIIEKQNNDSINRYYFFKVAGRFWNMKDTIDYKKITSFLIKQSESALDTFSMAKACSYMGDYFVLMNKPDSSYYYFDKSIKFYNKIKNSEEILEPLFSKAQIQHKYTDYLGYEKSAFDILRIIKGRPNKIELRYEANNLLGIAYGELSEFELSRKYYNIALSLCADKSIPLKNHFKAATLNNLGRMCTCQKKYKISKIYCEIGLKEANLRKDNPSTYAMLLSNLGHAKFRLNELDDLPDLFYQSLKIRDSLNDAVGVYNCYAHLAEFYLLKNDNIKALDFAKKTYKLTKENNFPRDQMYAVRILTKADPSKAFEYLQEYYRLFDSIEIADRRIKNKFARIEFETDNLIQQQKQLKAENAKKDRKLITVASLFGLALLLMIITYLLNRQRLKNRELAILRRQQQSESELYELRLAHQQQHDQGRQQEKKRIARELHDGIMGKLSAIRMNLFVLTKRTDPETIQKSLAHIDTLREVEQEIRNIAYDLGQTAFADSNDFIPVLRNMLQSAETATGMQTTLITEESIAWQDLDNNSKMQLYRILQEALQNTVKYAGASSLSVTISQANNILSIEINDNGKGFDKKNTGKGLGLRNMKERARELQGKLKIESKPNAGTTLTLTFPLTIK
ncbi:tetratricopeptide repeat-containing sensor histidine kinase [Flavobacterium pallidum]|uniref:Oxygen sensor histidine kinase NreB n=1 Tax=Flavobacterium pallidum TaxID=2172098 RepID=A0A2S1SEX1_9FLAO|nr:sensor histidine kinase [Flavobacterium pallidum]AWI24924.1 hypothetical protein HYN49_02885 [Flavobacterium pallidum]